MRTEAEMGTRAQRGLDQTDAMPPELRACVHEFGIAIVTACMNAGVTRPGPIRQLVHEIWHGARGSNNVGNYHREDQSRSMNMIDWLLIQSGSEISAATLVRLLFHAGMIIVPREPDTTMINASMAEVTRADPVVTKKEKHRRRLRAALDAKTRKLWPHLFTK